ncbi:hypothetical protein XI08_02835 [Bradyrhizobium sp. CCBAU 11361]|nr:DUF2231 domain-containing protein [Bradyrhizobium sp. CCBAU 11361]MDA9488166.1 hypothetical protein [Bradyrhizobium sp. CCBAU 11361]
MQQHLRVRTTAQIAGHPIHPMLVPIPIACFIGALQDVVTGFLNGDSQARCSSPTTPCCRLEMIFQCQGD